MKPPKKFSFKKRIISFKYAFQGVADLFYTEHNAWIHLIAIILVIILGVLLKIKPVEWILIVIVVGLVIVAELFNTAIEKLADIIKPEQNAMIGKIKDLSAGAVLISAITALFVGGAVFVPKILDWMRSFNFQP